MKRTMPAILAAGLLFVGAAQATTIIQLDQFGNGLVNSTPISGYLSFDSLDLIPNVLTYSLPFTGDAGDLVLTDPNFSDLPMEILSFNGNGTVYFFAGNNPNSLAYVPSPPGIDYASVSVVSDMGPEDSNYAIYTPGPGDPGWDSSGPTYIIDNGLTPLSAPEPATIVLVGAALGWIRRMKNGVSYRAEGFGESNR